MINKAHVKGNSVSPRYMKTIRFKLQIKICKVQWKKRHSEEGAFQTLKRRNEVLLMFVCLIYNEGLSLKTANHRLNI